MSKLFACVSLALAASLSPRMTFAQGSSSGDTTYTSSQTYYDFQVDRLVKYKAGPTPAYPYQLRSARVEGEVLVQFVVDEHGSVQMDSFSVIKSTDDLFEQAVRRAVKETLYYPAELRGRKVRQLVQQPFKFAIKS